MPLSQEEIDQVHEQFHEVVDLMMKQITETIEKGHRPNLMIFVVDAETGNHTWALRGVISQMAWVGWLQFLMNSVIAHHFQGKIVDSDAPAPLANWPVSADGGDGADTG